MSRSVSDSWYLDPVVAEQKAAENRRIVGLWAQASREGTVLKTDLFEEANGDDHILAALRAYGARVVAVDVVPSTVARAHQRFQGAGFEMSVTDLRAMSYRPGTFDLIISNSTLDHFDTRKDLLLCLAELSRTLRPGGRMIVALDNPLNPTYWPLRALCHLAASFRLGRTLGRRSLRRELEKLNLRIVGDGYAIHNPRLFSTVIFLLLRRLLRSRAEPAVRGLVYFFGLLDRLPTRSLTACFAVVCAERPTH